MNLNDVVDAAAAGLEWDGGDVQL